MNRVGLPIAWLALTGVLLAAGCRREKPSFAAEPATDFNLLLITLDTTRADHLGCYGHPVVETPHIDRFAREGVQFNQCSTAAPITLPSHCTIMTGTEPYVHTVRANGALPLPGASVTLAELLKSHGYRTAARVGAFVLDRRWGLAQGFDSYEAVEADPSDRDPEEDDGMLAISRSVTFAERTGDEVRRSAVEWLKQNASQKFFLWAHLFDPHQPYEPPEPYRTAYRIPYDGEIAFADEQVGLLYEALQDLGVAERTIVLIVGDHGEGLGEHGEPTHLNYVYDTTVHVPLILWCPGRLPAGRGLDAQVRTLDIVPTLLDLLGLPAKEDAQGTSLLGLARGETDDLDLTGYSETFVPYFMMGYAQTRALRRGGWKYIHLPKPELYHLTDDPKELTNLIEQEPDRAQAMRDQLREQLAAAPPPVELAGPVAEVDAEALQRLAALGYVAPSPDEATLEESELDLFEPVGDDPKDRLLDIQQLGAGIGAVHHRNYEAAVGFFRQLVERGAERPGVLRWYTESLIALGRLEEAIEQLAVMAEGEPTFAATHNDWAVLLYRLGRYDEAVERYDIAVQLRPEIETYRVNLGSALVDAGRLDEAEAQFRKVLEINPESGDAHNGLGNIMADRGQPEQAEAMYRKAVELEPEKVAPHYNLGRLLFTQGRLDEAVAAYRGALAKNPNHVNSYNNLGNTLLKQGRLDEALDAYQQMLRLDPRRVTVFNQVGFELVRRADFKRALAVFRHVVATVPEYKMGLNNLAWLLATTPEDTLRNGAEAVRLAEELCRDPRARPPGVLDTLAAAYAETGQFDRAVQTLQEAIELAAASESPQLRAQAEEMKSRLRDYEQQKPYRQEAGRAPATRSE